MFCQVVDNRVIFNIGCWLKSIRSCYVWSMMEDQCQSVICRIDIIVAKVTFQKFQFSQRKSDNNLHLNLVKGGYVYHMGYMMGQLLGCVKHLRGECHGL